MTLFDLRKLLCLKWGGGGGLFFGPKSTYVNFFSKSVYQIFLKLKLMTGINGFLDFQGKLMLCSKCGKWVIFGPKIIRFLY